MSNDSRSSEQYASYKTPPKKRIILKKKKKASPKKTPRFRTVDHDSEQMRG